MCITVNIQSMSRLLHAIGSFPYLPVSVNSVFACKEFWAGLSKVIKNITFQDLLFNFCEFQQVVKQNLNTALV
jgi:hypothetical protein